MPRRTAAVALALLTGAGLATVPVAPSGAAERIVSSRSVSTLPCADLMVVGVRGSGEKAPFGPTVADIRTTLLARWTGTSTSVWIDYPAANPHDLREADIASMLLDAPSRPPEYFASVAVGVAQLEAVLADSSSRCPRQRVVVVGFSQGAQVVSSVLAGSPRASTISASLLVGNPSHFPGQNVRELDAQVDSPAIGLQSLLAYLRARLDALPSPTRRAKVDHLLADVFELHAGRVSSADIAATLQGSGVVMPPRGYPTTFSVCARDDLVCDAAPPLSRVLTQTSTMEAEFARTRPVHGTYRADDMPRSLDAIWALLAPSGKVRTLAGPTPTPSAPVVTVAPASISPGPSRSPRPAPAPRSAGGRSSTTRETVAALAVTALAAGAVGYLLGRRGRR